MGNARHAAGGDPADPGAAVASTLARLESERLAAILAGDIGRLDALLDDAMVYVHASATQEDKALYLSRIASGYYRYLSFETGDRAVRLAGDVALVNGDLRIEVMRDGVHKLGTSRYLQVWRRHGEGWKLLSWQSVPVPG